MTQENKETSWVRHPDVALYMAGYGLSSQNISDLKRLVEDVANYAARVGAAEDRRILLGRLGKLPVLGETAYNAAIDDVRTLLNEND